MTLFLYLYISSAIGMGCGVAEPFRDATSNPVRAGILIGCLLWPIVWPIFVGLAIYNIIKETLNELSTEPSDSDSTEVE
jgi:hypothetical protein